MPRGLFITGNHTGVGKTVVTAAVVRYLRRQELDAVPMKPVQTGADSGDYMDLEMHLQAARLSVTKEQKALMCPYCFKTPCSPHLAAALEGTQPDLATVESCVANLLCEHDAVIVEGAGGVLSPFNSNASMLTLMALLKFPVVLVAGVYLGAINHTLLSIQALQGAGLEFAGVVFSEIDPTLPEYVRRDTVETVVRLGHVCCLGVIPHLPALQQPGETPWDEVITHISGRNTLLHFLGWK